MQQSKRRGNVLAFWHTLRCLCAALPTHIIELPVDWSDRFNLITNYELFVSFFTFPPHVFVFIIVVVFVAAAPVLVAASRCLL